MFHIIGMVIVGLIAGALARLIIPGKDPMGILATILLGIAGSFVGGLIARALLGPKDGEGLLRPSFLFSILGAILLLWVWRMIQRRSTSTRWLALMARRVVFDGLFSRESYGSNWRARRPLP